MADNINDGVQDVSFEDSLLIEADGYQGDAFAAVMEPFRAAYSTLSSRYASAMESADGFDDDGDLYRETRWIEWQAQQGALTLMALTCLQSYTMSFLVSLRQHYSKHLPPRKEREPEIQYVTRIYKNAGINVKRLASYDVIDDVREARNSTVHGTDTEPSPKYLRRENKRVLNSEGRISLNPEKLDVLIRECACFVRDVGSELHKREVGD